MPYFMLTTNGLMHVGKGGNGDEEEEETPQKKVGDIVQPWTAAKTNKVERHMALWICKSSQPFSTTENKYFRDMMMTTTNGAFSGPCTETIENVSLHHLMFFMFFS